MIQIDTSKPGTHTILFFATDQNGLTGTATRIVNVVDLNEIMTGTTTSTTAQTTDGSTASSTPANDNGTASSTQNTAA